MKIVVGQPAMVLIRRFVSVAVVAGAFFLCSGCRNVLERKAAPTEQDWSSVSNKISIAISDDGPTDVGVTDQGRWRNVLVRVENRSDRALHLVSLKEVSDYVRERNPQAICYRVESLTGSWQDTWRGLGELAWIGESASKWSDFPAGAIVEFRAPVPVDVPLTRDKPIRFRIRIYISREAPGRDFYSNEINR